jgi:alanine racemase
MIFISYSIKDISLLCKAQIFRGTSDEMIHQIVLDSRKSSPVHHSLFIALKGPHHDGHNYIKELYERGLRNFMISSGDIPYVRFPEANFIRVENTLRAFQKIARNHRNKFSIPVIGITGSHGKTIVKEWLSSCLKDLINISKSPKSYNSQTGVALSILGIKQETEWGIFEAGISQTNEMVWLEKMIQPSLGIFTNIGDAHSENFSTIKEKIHEKLDLFSSVKTLIYCKDHLEIHQEISTKVNTQIYSWSFVDEKAFLHVKNCVQEKYRSKITICWQQKEILLTIPFIDKASIENCLHVICALLVMNVEVSHIKKRIKTLRALEMRLDLLKAVENSLLINDAYSSDLDSLKIALDFLDQQSGNAKKIAILSDLEQTTLPKKEHFQTLLKLLKRSQVETLIGVGPQFSAFSNLFSRGYFYASTQNLLNNIDNIDLKDSAILIKGARKFKFEQIAGILEQKKHETVLEVNLNALAENFHYFKSLLRRETKVMVMVKAFSYGNGSYEIAHHLEYHQADYLAVAYLDEGISLRKKGIKTPIMVLNSEESQFLQLIEYDLEPEIFSFRQLYAFQSVLKDLGLKSYSTHLKIDTGMRRLGFEITEIDSLCDWFNFQEEIKIASVFSHLASSENQKDRKFTLNQIHSFDQACQKIKNKVPSKFLRHILNSSGIIKYPEAQLDMVRLGVGLYGIGKENLKNCSTLKSTISQIKNISPGQSVGYARSYIAKHKIKIAVIPIGYADGLSRGLSNCKGKVYIKGSAAPIVGNVCMDMCMVNVTDLNAKEGDPVIIWDKQDHILDLAEALNTIPYEILSQVSQRVKRIFVKE